jgi:hypothetical protein
MIKNPASEYPLLERNTLYFSLLCSHDAAYPEQTINSSRREFIKPRASAPENTSKIWQQPESTMIESTTNTSDEEGSSDGSSDDEIVPTAAHSNPEPQKERVLLDGVVAKPTPGKSLIPTTIPMIACYVQVCILHIGSIDSI